MTAPSRTLVMGVVNVTPDSFSDGGRFTSLAAGLDHALALVDAGADWLDIGGESTRPGAEPVDETRELERVIPLIEAIAARSPVKLSIDTMKPAVALAAKAAGASMWNDVAALRQPSALDAAAQFGGAVTIMHMLGEPRTMQVDPRYGDVVGEVEAFLLERAQAAVEAGVARESIWLDPGIGFGKTPAHNLSLLSATSRLAAHGYALLVGASRKRFIAALDPGAEPNQRLGGSLACALLAARAGAAMVRVHDVRETVQGLRVQAAVLGCPS